MSIADKLTELNTEVGTLATKIRNKGGTVSANTIKACQAGVDSIQTGSTGITPSGNIELTKQTGTDVSTYATASVRSASITGATDGKTIDTFDSNGIAMYQSGDSEEKGESLTFKITVPFHLSHWSANTISNTLTTSGWISSGIDSQFIIDVGIDGEISFESGALYAENYLDESDPSNADFGFNLQLNVNNSSGNSLISGSSEQHYYRIKRGTAMVDDGTLSCDEVTLSGTTITIKGYPTTTIGTGWYSGGTIEGEIDYVAAVPTEEITLSSSGTTYPSNGKLIRSVTANAGSATGQFIADSSEGISYVKITKTAGFISGGTTNVSVPTYDAEGETLSVLNPKTLSNNSDELTSIENNYILGTANVQTTPGIPAIMSGANQASINVGWSSSLTYLNICIKGSGTTTGTVYSTFCSGYASTSYYHRSSSCTRAQSSGTASYPTAPIGRFYTTTSTYPYAMLVLNRVMPGDTITFRMQSTTGASNSSYGTAVSYTVPSSFSDPHRMYNSTNYYDILFIITVNSSSVLTFYPYII